MERERCFPNDAKSLAEEEAQWAALFEPLDDKTRTDVAFLVKGFLQLNDERKGHLLACVEDWVEDLHPQAD